MASFLSQHDVLQNVETSSGKSRNTFSKNVGGRCITEDETFDQIQSHIALQNKHSKPSSSKSKPPSLSKIQETNAPLQSSSKTTMQSCTPNINQPGPSHINLAIDNQEDGSDDSDFNESELCCVSRQFTPKSKGHYHGIKFIKWAPCDKCAHWCHLKYCTKVSVLCRHSTFYCPCCDKNGSKEE